jgi:hypothetical protein
MNADEKITVVELSPAPILIEVQTERLLQLMSALYDNGFELKHVRGRTNRFKVQDREVKRPKA